MIVGVLGAGQLGRMLALAGYPLGLRFRFLDTAPDSPAGHLADLVTASYDDREALERFARGLDVVTYEFENVPVEAAGALEGWVPVYPPPRALEAAQERLVEKGFFQGLGIPTPPFAPVGHARGAGPGAGADRLSRRPQDLPPGDTTARGSSSCASRWTRRGRGNCWAARLRATTPPPSSWRASCSSSGRSRSSPRAGETGETAFYPLVENHHPGGILGLSLAPAPNATHELQALAEEYATRVLDALGYVGVLTIEFFQEGGRLLANEMAPRVHNSGHWTIEGAETSQFENHLRAVLGLPLGSTPRSAAPPC
jgi:5-(carboxyamino)imidazole ribonucleotide synthase